jgi:hypothetical protein
MYCILYMNKETPNGMNQNEFKLYFLIGILCVLACAGSKPNFDQLPPSSDFIEYTIEKIDRPEKPDGIWIRQNIKNISNCTITLLQPYALDVSVMPHCIDSYGQPLGFPFKFQPLINVETTSLLPDEVISLPWCISHDFDLTIPGTYTIWFEYRSAIRSADGNFLSYGKFINSNKIQIIIS